MLPNQEIHFKIQGNKKVVDTRFLRNYDILQWQGQKESNKNDRFCFCRIYVIFTLFFLVIRVILRFCVIFRSHFSALHCVTSAFM